MLTETQNFTAEDIEYVRHGDRPLMMRLLRPVGDGPFPTVVDLHPGAWCKGSLSDCQARDEFLVEAGFATAAIDFRHAGDGYPTSLADINYAVRWLKADADSLRLDPDRLGLAGQSSGGHLAMLAAIRPHDPRYAAIALGDGHPATDATVRCVAMMWPVINPLSRYHHALRVSAAPNPPDWVAGIPESHDLYWVTEANMAEGNPMVALENGETLETPPALWIQGQPDDVHDYRDPESALPLNEPERFAHNYRNAGGEIEMAYIGQPERATEALGPLVKFLAKHL